MKKRSRTAKQGRAGVIAVEQACNELDLIWRSLIEEDVGVDGTIEIALGEFPTGKIIGVQVKSGRSYIRSESETSFKFYPHKDDLDYWRKLSIPLFLLIHHPDDGNVYWVDVSSAFSEEQHDQDGVASITFSKTNKLDKAFEANLHGRFDLTVYSSDQYAALRKELEALVHRDGSGRGIVEVTALDLFVEGLWGLCSKLQFHSSLLADMIRKTVREREGQIPITYTFNRAGLYPFFSTYFSLLARHHIALIDAADISESLYGKLEYPTFIAPLTTNGRRFVKYLQAVGLPRVHDNQYMTLSLHPHIQIEVYAGFDIVDDQARFGPYTDVLAIRFNAYLDYYHLSHWHRARPEQPAVEVARQNIHYHALRDYISTRFKDAPKNNVLFRHRDIPLSPLICWLVDWNDDRNGVPSSWLRGRSGTETMGFADEMRAILGPIGVATTREPPEPTFPNPNLGNGEYLDRSSADRNTGSAL
ncbi:DUF4365 domain-containing protein [Mesorhizobium sp. M0340]|uniref:DUF4365 domain-containing protein n=1 Tax=Mesorhizobium sp. M0340 TaxID=2956939 RepID=UPI0033351B8D